MHLGLSTSKYPVLWSQQVGGQEMACLPHVSRALGPGDHDYVGHEAAARCINDPRHYK